MTVQEDLKRTVQSRFWRHTTILIWKSYLQRQRRWRILLAETLLACIIFLLAIFTAKPVFLTPLQAQLEPPMSITDLLKSLDKNVILGYAPNVNPYVQIMNRAAAVLQHDILNAPTEDDLNDILIKNQQAEHAQEQQSVQPISHPIIWVIWQANEGDQWKLNIRSTERARYETRVYLASYSNTYMRAGFLAVQVAISHSILEYSSPTIPQYEVNLVSMPVSPLMEESKVRNAIWGILILYTVAFMPPVLETVALVVHETRSGYKRTLRILGVDYSSMYVGWLVFAMLTALPICLLAAVTLIFIFRWTHLIFAVVLMLSYVLVMVMPAFIMAMFHSKDYIACIWIMLFTLLQGCLAQLLIHHDFDTAIGALPFLLHVVLAPLGLGYALKQCALLQTGHGDALAFARDSEFSTIAAWLVLSWVYFLILLLLQRTIGQERAIGGQVSWKSIIFKKAVDVNKLETIETPTGHERDQLEEVDELVAKAVSFSNVSKSIMGIPVLNNITMDIYRGEYTTLSSERNQKKMLGTMEDLLLGLTLPDKGSVNVLGNTLAPNRNFLTMSHMIGYCNHAVFLIDDLTVHEHFVLFYDANVALEARTYLYSRLEIQNSGAAVEPYWASLAGTDSCKGDAKSRSICLWSETRQYIEEYSDIRARTLLYECDLEVVKNQRIRFLDIYYKSQLCWALAMLLEPRVVIIPSTSEVLGYAAVIRDKILQYKKYVTIIKMTFDSSQMEYADRVFIFDSKILAFGGTPAYLFYKHGREYRVRMTVRSDRTLEDDECTNRLLQRVMQAGATIRAHLGSLLILRLAASPTENVANLISDLNNNAKLYGMSSLNISVPDLDEVNRRAVNEAIVPTDERSSSNEMRRDALKRIAEPVQWKRKRTIFSNIPLLRYIGWKYFSFYMHYRFVLLVTLVSALAVGTLIGQSFSYMLTCAERENTAKKLLHGSILTVEEAEQKTTLLIRSDESGGAKSMADAYVLSEPNSTKIQVDKIKYTAIPHTESLTEYLVTRAIDSPKIYVFMYAYGLDVFTNENDSLIVNALYSPLHYDKAAAVRSMGRAYTALLRHYTGNFEASIQLTDAPLALDLTPWMREATKSSLLIQFLLILTISHVTLIPSKEYGMVRHFQSHAMNFSPARYWFTLYFCDLIVYWILVALMTGVMILIMYLKAPPNHFVYSDLAVIPFTLIVYAMGCIPQAYLFSLGPHVALNSATYIFVNIVFSSGKIIHGETLDYVLSLMSISPQYNVAYAFVKIKSIFLYNSECVIFKSQKLCTETTLNKCCPKCGVLQKCFYKQNYLRHTRTQIISMTTTATIFMVILLIIEYKVVQRLWRQIITRYQIMTEPETDTLQPGAAREKQDVLNKKLHIKTNRKEQVDTYGEYLLAENLGMKAMGICKLHSIYLGLGKGEALALTGLKKHGRLHLCEVIAGYRLSNIGKLYCMSKWKQRTQPHLYAQQISFCCEHETLPSWMTVYEALELIALLRGVPKKHVKTELGNYLEALELNEYANTKVCYMTPKKLTRLHFAAAVVGAPPIIVLDECTANQEFSVMRAMYYILYQLRKQGHAVFISSNSVESHIPVTSNVAIILDGRIYDIDTVDNLVGRYGKKGYTVVLQVKGEVNVNNMFTKQFRNFVINDTSEELVNVQVQDEALTWVTIFQKMEILKQENPQVDSYIVTVVTIDYVYNRILLNEQGRKASGDFFSEFRTKTSSVKHKPSPEVLARLMVMERKYHMTKLRELPWSGIFHS